MAADAKTITAPAGPSSTTAANAVYAEEAEKNAKFKKIYEPWKKFRDDQILWFRVAEQNFDSFMATVDQANEKSSGKTSDKAAGVKK